MLLHPTRLSARQQRTAGYAGQSVVITFPCYSGAQIHYSGDTHSQQWLELIASSVSIPRSVILVGYRITMYVIFRPHLATTKTKTDREKFENQLRFGKCWAFVLSIQHIFKQKLIRLLMKLPCVHLTLTRSNLIHTRPRFIFSSFEHCACWTSSERVLYFWIWKNNKLKSDNIFPKDNTRPLHNHSKWFCTLYISTLSKFNLNLLNMYALLLCRLVSV